MPAYLNAGGDSNVVAYDVDPNGQWIVVTFAGGKVRNYEYTAASAGANNLRHMIALAQAGRGLNSFVMHNVRYGYSRKY